MNPWSVLRATKDGTYGPAISVQTSEFSDIRWTLKHTGLVVLELAPRCDSPERPQSPVEP